MEDKKLKNQLKKIPDVDKNGDPIYKIDNESKKPNIKIERKPKIPLFVKDTSESPQGNAQDIKNSTEE